MSLGQSTGHGNVESGLALPLSYCGQDNASLCYRICLTLLVFPTFSSTVPPDPLPQKHRVHINTLGLISTFLGNYVLGMAKL